MKFTFTFQNDEDRILAVCALDNLYYQQRTDARNPELGEDRCNSAALTAAQAFRVAREIENLSQREAA